ncbi:solute carrier family 23 member 2-like [Pomacea canaliculata]|nr:solute carrier family 23 member 2-like [Pomacea canaliculata]XP_025095627.1 solute carrier family 23 member 2-like [Pomacea canaliculata]
MVASLLEVVIGVGGFIRPLLRYIGPITVAPTISLIGLSLFKLPVIYGKINPPIALASAVLVIIFALYLGKVHIPIPSCSKEKVRTSLPVFQLLPILLALLVMWVVSAILTVAGVFPNDPTNAMFYSRTDAKNEIIRSTPWLQFVYPGQFGPPSFSLAAMIGFVGAVVSSVVESVGDYFAVSRACEVPLPPDHAISRGILMEGLGSVLSGAVGSAHATTSYSGNIAMVTLTKTASRSVMLVAGLFLVLVSLIGKAGAVFASLPPPILGGLTLVLLGLLGSLGLSSLKFVDLSSNRNLLIIGIAFMCGLSIPAFMEEHGDMLSTGVDSVDQVVGVVLGTPMLLGGLTALILDNTVSGTKEERGLLKWKQIENVDTGEAKTCSGVTTEETYSFPCFSRRSLPRWITALPFLPPVTKDPPANINEV